MANKIYRKKRNERYALLGIIALIVIVAAAIIFTGGMASGQFATGQSQSYSMNVHNPGEVILLKHRDTVEVLTDFYKNSPPPYNRIAKVRLTFNGVEMDSEGRTPAFMYDEADMTVKGVDSAGNIISSNKIILGANDVGFVYQVIGAYYAPVPGAARAIISVPVVA